MHILGFAQAFDRYAYVLNNPLRYTDPSGHWYYDPGCDCMVDNGEPDRQYPENLSCQRDYNENVHLPPIGPEYIKNIDGNENGLCIGKNCSGTWESNWENIKWNASMLHYEIDRRDVECPGCVNPIIGIGVDVFGLVADGLAVVGFPELEVPATVAELTWISIRYSDEDIGYNTQLFIDQQNADKLAGVPGTGAPFSLWGIFLNIIDISQRFEYSIGH